MWTEVSNYFQGTSGKVVSQWPFSPTAYLAGLRLARWFGIDVKRRKYMGNLDQKVIVVTGAAGAIGRAAVDVFKREGATVVGVDLRHAEDTGADEFICCDLTMEDQVRDLYGGLVGSLGRLDGLFNNAGVALAEDTSVLDEDQAVFARTLRINVDSVLLCCKHGIPHLIAGGGGAVVNTASLVASMGSAVSQIGYTASKGAVVAMSREMAVEFARKGVRVAARRRWRLRFGDSGRP